jgi:hypothetical protein
MGALRFALPIGFWLLILSFSGIFYTIPD